MTIRHPSLKRGRADKALARLRCERGQSLITFGLFIGVVLGFFALVTNVGELFATSRKAQNAADAGALAGAQQLCPAQTDGAKRTACEDKAETLAAEYATSQYNMPEGTPTVTLLTNNGQPVSASNPYTKVRVQIDADAPMFFAGWLGVSSTVPVGSW